MSPEKPDDLCDKLARAIFELFESRQIRAPESRRRTYDELPDRYRRDYLRHANDAILPIVARTVAEDREWLLAEVERQARHIEELQRKIDNGALFMKEEKIMEFMKEEKIMEPRLSLDEAKAVVATKTAPRVTEESIRAKIASVDYLTPEIVNDHKSNDMTTICKVRMTNGFVFIGHSTPASKANFDEEVGKRYAYENAFKQIWAHEGYLLRERLSESARSKP